VKKEITRCVYYFPRNVDFILIDLDAGGKMDSDGTAEPPKDNAKKYQYKFLGDKGCFFILNDMRKSQKRHQFTRKNIAILPIFTNEEKLGQEYGYFPTKVGKCFGIYVFGHISTVVNQGYRA
jgi:hypothetical protein